MLVWKGLGQTPLVNIILFGESTFEKLNVYFDNCVQLQECMRTSESNHFGFVNLLLDEFSGSQTNQGCFASELEKHLKFFKASTMCYFVCAMKVEQLCEMQLVCERADTDLSYACGLSGNPKTLNSKKTGTISHCTRHHNCMNLTWEQPCRSKTRMGKKCAVHLFFIDS